MPYRRRIRRSRRKPTTKSYRIASIRRAMGVMPMTLRKTLANKVYYFKRVAYFPGHIQSVLTSGGIPTNGAVGDIFRLSDVPNVTDYTNLFDQYKILKVKVEFMPRGNVSETAQAGSVLQSTFVNLWNVIDKDNVTAPASLNELLQYQTLKCVRSNQRLVRYFTPSQLVETFNNGITTAYSVNLMPKWIDCANSSVQHFGMKTWLEAPTAFGSGLPPTANIYINYDYKVTYYLAFKNVI